MLDVTYNSQKIIDSLEVTPPVEVTYNGSTIATLNTGDTKTLQCNGKVMASNIGIGGKTLQCSSKLMASDVVVKVGGVTPTGETWVINEFLGPIEIRNFPTTDINFISNNIKYNRISSIFKPGSAAPEGLLYYDTTTVFYNASGGWLDEAYRTVTFETPPTGYLLTWLQDNAVKQ